MRRSDRARRPSAVQACDTTGREIGDAGETRGIQERRLAVAIARSASFAHSRHVITVDDFAVSMATAAAAYWASLWTSAGVSRGDLAARIRLDTIDLPYSESRRDDCKPFCDTWDALLWLDDPSAADPDAAFAAAAATGGDGPAAAVATVPTTFAEIDAPGGLRLVYSDPAASLDPGSCGDACKCQSGTGCGWNREHSWPQSWGAEERRVGVGGGLGAGGSSTCAPPHPDSAQAPPHPHSPGRCARIYMPCSPPTPGSTARGPTVLTSTSLPDLLPPTSSAASTPTHRRVPPSANRWPARRAEHGCGNPLHASGETSPERPFTWT